MLQTTRVGYRTEAFRGSKVRDAVKVLDFEWNEMGNSGERVEVAEALGYQGNTSEEQLFKVIRWRFGDGAVVIWLATWDGVLTYAEENPDIVIDQYIIPDSALLITDLGLDGQLFLMSHSAYDGMLKTKKELDIEGRVLE